MHDPTTLNRQGNDTGTQYRSAIFYHSEEQRQTAELVKASSRQERAMEGPITTEITAAGPFYLGGGVPPEVPRQESRRLHLSLSFRD